MPAEFCRQNMICGVAELLVSYRPGNSPFVPMKLVIRIDNGITITQLHLTLLYRMVLMIPIYNNPPFDITIMYQFASVNNMSRRVLRQRISIARK
jgi:hypothetical protein